MKITKNLITNRNDFAKGGNQKLFIVNHHTGSKAPFQNIINFFKRPDYISTHYVVSAKGEVVQLIEEDDRAYHAGVSSFDGYKNLNRYSIGIEIHSDGKNFTDVQRQAVVELNLDIMRRNKISSRRVVRHADIAPQRKWDVGPNFYLQKWGSWKGFQQHLAKLVKKEKPKTEIELNWEWGIENGITNGDRPKDSINREECVTMIKRAIDLMLKEITNG